MDFDCFITCQVKEGEAPDEALAMGLDAAEVPRQSLRRGRQKSISPQGSGFQKWRPSPETVLNEFTRSSTLAWSAPSGPIAVDDHREPGSRRLTVYRGTSLIRNRQPP